VNRAKGNAMGRVILVLGVHYESGGIAHSYHVLVVRVDHHPRSAHVVWSAAAISMKSSDDFVHARRGSKFDDALPHYK
jgi:hypothetical protein